MMHGILKQVNTGVNKRFEFIKNMWVTKVRLAVMNVLMQQKTLDWCNLLRSLARVSFFQCSVMSLLTAEWVEHLQRLMRCWCRRTCFEDKLLWSKSLCSSDVNDQMSLIKIHLQRLRLANKQISFVLHLNISRTTFYWLNFKKSHFATYMRGIQSVDIWSHALAVSMLLLANLLFPSSLRTVQCQ